MVTATTFRLCPAFATRTGAAGRVSQRAPRRAVRAMASEGSYDYDLFTIGGGSGGVRGSRFSGTFGAKVAIAELPFAYESGDNAGGLGGTCVLRGCVPKKLVMYCSEYRQYFKDAQGFGYAEANPELDWKKFMDKKHQELHRLNDAYGNTLSKGKVKHIEGRAKLLDPHTVEVNGQQYTAKYIMLAVGGTPKMIGLPGVEHCINSDGILELDEVPKRLGIIGGGYIGVEFGGMFNNLGSEVNFFIRGEKLLRGFDEEIRDKLHEEYGKQGIKINNGCSPKEFKKNDDGSITVTYSTPSGEDATMDFDKVLMATGRGPNTKNLGLEEAGVETDDAGFIKVDEYSKTNIDNIYAVGDITDRMALTPVALMEGGAVANTLFNNNPTKPDHMFVPTAVFSQPHIGTCGYPEDKAVEKFGDVDVFTSGFTPMRIGFAGGLTRGYYKIIVDKNSDRVVGMHMIGPDSGEIMQGFGVAMKAGITKKQIDTTVGIHPTSAEELCTMRSSTRSYRGGKLQE